ncbi:ATP-dependent DNA ligase [Ralstonia phage phiAp1]|uniref:DNA ligase n=1 Tax=Ralstonia phage phiAp1 TaxID=2783867 RepID=A0A1L7DSA8_9CAUD|nr:ATP-dependent DNA ligase [Ralstonia phage phiAp1]APU03163.1 DNA ligase [Ralstonia phage phiAp1]
MSIGKLMKGHTFAKGKKKLTWPAVAEIKLDEIRLDVRAVEGKMGWGVAFQSFADKPLLNLGDYAGSFLELMNDVDVRRLDCGVLVNRSFNDTYRYVRSKTLPPELAGAKVEFILFDVPEDDRPFGDRMHYLDTVAQIGVHYGLAMIRPERAEVKDEEQVWGLFASARERGFEGLMVKDYGHLYELDKRTNGWLKVKPEEDEDGIITAINQAHSLEGVPLDRAGSVTITVPGGSGADASGIPHELGRLMQANPDQFIGQWATFSYMERDRQGGYRHPRFERIREEKA